jgi:hypothetical protein
MIPYISNYVTTFAVTDENSPTFDASRCITPSSQHLTNDSLSRILSTPPTQLTQTSLAYPTPSPSPEFHAKGRMGYQSYQNLTNYPNYQNYALRIIFTLRTTGVSSLPSKSASV